LVTVIEYVPFAPETKFPVWLFCIVRSALTEGEPGADEVLFAVTGSAVPFASIEPTQEFDPVPIVPLQTMAVLVTEDTTSEFTVTTRVIGEALAPTASVGAAV
jgi:hypothetical protein